MHKTICPACGAPEHYRLNDNRLQCASCRKKYTVGTRRSKLSPQAMEVIARSFWRMIPASAAAAEQGMNSKTLQKYYDLLRRTITEASERYAAEQFGTTKISTAHFHDSSANRAVGTDVKPLFCLAQGMGQTALLLPAEEPEGDIPIPEIAGWIYAQDRTALDSLDLDRIHFLRAIETKPGAPPTNFWIYAKRGLVRYHGGFRKNFHLFMREMEFRFNNQDEDATRNLLIEMLQRDIT